jgi:hypothetical protein
MNILTDILSLIRRGKFTETAHKDDVVVLGMWNEKPDMTGVASPIPYKSVKLIKVKDLASSENCDTANAPASPETGSVGIFQKQDVDPTTNKCTVYLRSLKSLSSNLTLNLSADDNYIEIDTDGEPNTAANLGNGIGVWADKVGETLNFKSLVAGSNINLSENNGEITITSAAGGGEVNTASNVGIGAGTFAQKAGPELQFRSLTSSNGSVAISQNTDNIDIVAPYTEYRVLLTQTGTNAPAETVLVNTAGITITWAYQGVGQYTATFASPISNVASINIAQVFKNSGYLAQINSVTTNGFELRVMQIGVPVGPDDQLLNTELLIKQY